MLGFTEYKRTAFKTNFLRSVVFQIKYPKNSAILNKHEEIKKILSPVFHNSIKQETSTLKIQNVDSKTQFLPTRQGVSGFLFTTKDSHKSLSVSDTTINVTFNGEVYTSFENLWSEIEPMLLDILKLNGISDINWVSMRKINLIQFAISDEAKAYEGLATVFNTTLVNQYLSFPNKEYLDSGISNFALKKDGVNLNLTLGLIPSKDENKNLILDIDLFCNKENLQTNQLKGKLFEINQEIFNIFHWCLQDKTIERLTK